ERSHREHALVVSLTVSLEARALVAVGPRMGAALDGAGDLRRLQAIRVESAAEAAAPALEWARPEDVILVKGSRGLRMERALDALSSGASS
ncbi:MAG: hypothetical protein GXP55_00645, partial [Deltaproteobacteria bacterium]|nr:hypothetical protein [Deltaproteobacteria bacterium]